MSHFSTIKTKLVNKDTLLKSLLLLGEKVDINQTLENPVGHNHDKLICDITVGTDIGFRFNKVTNAYELVTDLQTWNRSIPPKVFLDRVTQQYAVNTIVNTVEDDGFTILENKKTLDGSIELTCTKWD